MSFAKAHKCFEIKVSDKIQLIKFIGKVKLTLTLPKHVNTDTTKTIKYVLSVCTGLFLSLFFKQIKSKRIGFYCLVKRERERETNSSNELVMSHISKADCPSQVQSALSKTTTMCEPPGGVRNARALSPTGLAPGCYMTLAALLTGSGLEWPEL